MEIAAQFELSTDEIRRALTRSVYRRYVPLFVGLLAYGAAYAALTDGVARGLGMGLAFLAGARLLLLTFMLQRAVLAAARIIGGPSKILLTPSALRIGTPMVVSEWTWEAFITAKTTKEFWLLKPTRSSNVIIPRRALAPADAEVFDAFCAAWTPTPVRHA